VRHRQGPRLRRPPQGHARRHRRPDGGKAIFEDLGIQLENVQLKDLGRAKKVKIDKDNTVIIEGAGKKADIQGRVGLIQRELEKSTSDYDKEKLSERIAKLSGGVAKINVGAATESEMKEKKARVEDAMHATRAANQEGILPGGGVALLRAAHGLKPKGLNPDEEAGYNIVVRACKSPSPRSSATPARTASGGQQGAGKRQRQLRLRRPPGPLLRPGQGRHHRPHQVVRSACKTPPRSPPSSSTSDALVAELPKEEKKAPAGAGARICIKA